MERQQQQDARLEVLDGELTKLQTELAETEQHRHAAEQRIESLEEQMRNPKVLPDRFAKRLAGVPAKEGKYERLISPAGHIHAEDVIYSSHNGSQLTFKVAGRPKSFPAAQIHPVILADLGLSLDGLRSDQSRMDAARNTKSQLANAASQARILSFASMMQRERAELVQIDTPPPAPVSQIQPTPAQMRELIARQQAFDQRQRERALANSAANGSVRIVGPSQGYGGGQERPRRCQPSR
ncbi:MAG: hypothetical protein ACPGVU_09690 [Limisphaerales bacterium]